MTIGIGVLASEKKKPDHLILISDTMGSFGDGFSTDRLHKMYGTVGDYVFALGSGDIVRAGEIFASIREHLDRTDKTHGDYGRTIAKVVQGYKMERYRMELLPRFMITPEQWFQVMDPELRNQLLEAWTTFDLGMELIVAGFNNVGQAELFTVSSDGEIQQAHFPGFACIGTGGGNAQFWLSYRHHHLGMSVRRACYHAYEAKLMAESAPNVNEHIEMLVGSVDKGWYFKMGIEKVDGCPISITELKELFSKLGPKRTDEMDL